MRHLILVLLCTSFTFHSLAQCDSSLVGVWKPISMMTGEIKFDFSNDSVTIARESKTYNADSASLNIKREMIKVLFEDFQYMFNRDGSFEISLTKNIKEQGSYCFKKEQGIITMTSKNALGESTSVDSKVKLTEGILYMTIDMDLEEPFEVILKKKSSSN